MDMLDPQIPEEPVMTFPGLLVGEQAEEQEHIPDSYSLVREMGLGSVTLAKNALSIQEHRVVMAKIMASPPAFGAPLDDVSQPEICVRGHRVLRCRNW